MQTNSHLQEKQRQIVQLTTEVQSFKESLELREDEMIKYKAALKEQRAAMEAREKLHADELEVKENMVRKLKEEMEKLEEEITAGTQKQPTVVRDHTREKELVGESDLGIRV